MNAEYNTQLKIHARNHSKVDPRIKHVDKATLSGISVLYIHQIASWFYFKFARSFYEIHILFYFYRKNSRTVKMSGCLVSTFYVILSLQLAFGYNTYQHSYSYSYRFDPHPQLGIRSTLPPNAVIPIMNQLNATQDVREAATQISEGSELFSFEMVHVSWKFKSNRK